MARVGGQRLGGLRSNQRQQHIQLHFGGEQAGDFERPLKPFLPATQGLDLGRELVPTGQPFRVGALFHPKQSLPTPRANGAVGSGQPRRLRQNRER